MLVRSDGRSSEASGSGKLKSHRRSAHARRRECDCPNRIIPAVALFALFLVAAPAQAKNADRDAEIAQLIRQLAHDDFEVREDATKRLLEIGVAAAPAVETALKDPTTDPEAVKLIGPKKYDYFFLTRVSPLDQVKIGALDFTRGAHASRGGLPIFALPSMARGTLPGFSL